MKLTTYLLWSFIYLFTLNFAYADGLSVDPSGNVGIGNIPISTSQLRVTASEPGEDILSGYNSDDALILELNSSTTNDGWIGIKDAAGVRKTQLNSNGRSYFLGGDIGIGTETPLAQLHLRTSLASDSEVTNSLRLEKYTSTPAAGSGQSIGFYNGYASGTPRVTIEMVYPEARFDKAGLVFKTTNKSTKVEALTLGYNGLVGVGYTTPSYKLDVNGTTRVATLIQSSDERLKKDIQPVKKSLDKLSKIRGVSYRWNDLARKNRNKNTKIHALQDQASHEAFVAEPLDDRTHFGLLAQEVEQIFPGVVYTGDDGMKSIAYAQLIGPMVEAIKELRQENRQLKKNYKNLQSELAAIRELIKSTEKM